MSEGKIALALSRLSEQCANALGIEQDLDRRDFRELLELDYFELIDRKTIVDLVQEVATIATKHCGTRWQIWAPAASAGRRDARGRLQSASDCGTLAA